jgi:O-antigen ligase
LSLADVKKIVPDNRSKGWFVLLVTAFVATVVVTIVTSDIRLLILPFGLLVGLLALTDYKKLYLLLWASIPFSTEVEFGSMGADLPDEGLMIVLTGIAILLFATKGAKMSMKMLLHPISLVLLLHFGWIGLTALSSTEPMVSLKFLAAKSWYIAVFYFLGYHIVRSEKDFIQWLRWLIIPILITVLVIWARHSTQGFSFESVNEFLNPFYRNHVDYALMLGVVFPFVWVFRKSWPGKYTGLIIASIFLLGISLAFTRAAYLGIFAAFVGFILIRTKTLKFALVAAGLALIVMFAFLTKNNRYIDYAPDYHKTISHTKFDNLIEATYNLEDISSMERIYRWISAFYMVDEKPVMGFGPGTFYDSYRPYTDEHFVTYVSDNPEKSGTHNYFLMTAADQGLPGLAIFLLLIVVALLKAQWLYPRLPDGYPKQLLSATVGTLFFIIFILLLNDMIETDKVGTFFFFCLAMLVSLEYRFLSPSKGKNLIDN